MKKSILILTLISIILLCACGKENKADDADNAPETSAEVTAVTNEPSSKQETKEAEGKTDASKKTEKNDGKEDDTLAESVADEIPQTSYSSSSKAGTGDCKHNYKSAVSIEATCSSTGVMKYTCTICGDSYTEKIPMTEHTVVTDAAVAATCQHTGLTEGSHCSKCGTVIVSQKETEKAEHTKVVNKTVEASCTEAGYTQYKCSVCGENLGSEAIPATGHSFVNGICTQCGILDLNNTPFSFGGSYELPEEDL